MRVGLIGGGTDLPCYLAEYGIGGIISLAINIYWHILIRKRPFDKNIVASYRKLEVQEDIENLDNELIRECLKYYGIIESIEIHMCSDISTKGSGLGSSSSAISALALGLKKIKNHNIDKVSVAEIYDIENKQLGAPIGIQDHVATVHGGLNQIELISNSYSLMPFSPIVAKTITDHLMLINTGIQRNSYEQLSPKNINTKEMHGIYDLYNDTVILLGKYPLNIFELARIVQEGWLIKRDSYKKCSNEEIDSLYNTLIKEGALGGKLCGSGGGGYLAIFVEDRTWFINKLKDKYVNIYSNTITAEPDLEGTRVLYADA